MRSTVDISTNSLTSAHHTVPQNWVEDANCAGTDGDEFFPDKGGSVNNAKKLCEECPVKQICLLTALAEDEKFGLWGGETENARRKLRGAVSPAGREKVFKKMLVTAYSEWENNR